MLWILYGLFTFNYSGFAQTEIANDTFSTIGQPESHWIKEIIWDLAGDLDYKKERKELKKFLKVSDDEYLEDFMLKLENDDEDRVTILRHCPFAYNVLFNAWYRCNSQKHQNPDLAYRYAAIAAQYGSQNAFTPEDAVLVRKVIKFAKRYNSSCFPHQRIKSAKELVSYMDELSNEYIEEKKKEANRIKNLGEEIQKKLLPLEKSSAQLEAQIKDFENQAENSGNINRDSILIDHQYEQQVVDDPTKNKIKKDLEIYFAEKLIMDNRIAELKQQLMKNEANMIGIINEPLEREDKAVKKALKEIEYYRAH